MSNLSTILQATYKPQREAEADLSKLGYTYDPESSTMERKVFTDKEGNPHFAHRGSVRVNDWVGNAIIGLTGKPDPKMKKEIEETENIIKTKYADKTPTFYGHSRSGMTSEYLGDKLGGQTYTFNKATSPSDIFKNIRKDQTDIRTTKDLVSLPSIFQTGNKKTLQSDKSQSLIDAHSTKNLGVDLDLNKISNSKFSVIPNHLKLQVKSIKSKFF